MAGMSGVMTGQFSDPVLKGSLLDTFRVSNEKNENLWKKMGFKELSSSKAFEEITEFAGIGIAPIRQEMQQAAVDIPKEGYTTRINQYSYGVNIPVSEEAKMFKQYRDAIAATENANESLANTVEVVCADMYANAFSSTVGLLPDGQPICSASHKLPRGGTYSTTLGAVAFSETGIESALITARKLPGGHGLPVGRKPTQLRGPVEYMFEADRILKSQGQNWTANNAINALKGQGLTYVDNKWFASVSNWFLGTECKFGLVIIWTMKPQVKEVGMDLQGATVYSAKEMFGIACVDPRSVLGSSV